MGDPEWKRFADSHPELMDDISVACNDVDYLLDPAEFVLRAIWQAGYMIVRLPVPEHDGGDG